jgi:hypothetical protein
MRICSILKPAKICGVDIPEASLHRPRRFAATDSACYHLSDVFNFNHGIEYTGDGLIFGGAPWPQLGGVCRILLFNGVGTGYGDLLCGTVAIKLLYEKIVELGYQPRLEIIFAPDHERQYREVFQGNPHVSALIPGAIPNEELGRAHALFTTDGFVADPVFSEIDMIDYFIWRFGLNPSEYSPETKLPVLPKTSLTEKGYCAGLKLREGDSKKVCLFNLHASGFRRISATIWRPMVEALSRAGYRVWLTGTPHRRGDISVALNQLGCAQFGAVDVLPLTPSWHELIGLIQSVDAVVTPDTSVLHIAGAAKKPCVGLMFSIEPKLRMSYYPTVRGYVRPLWKKSPWWGKSRMEELKEPLEDITEWRDAWNMVNAGGVVKLLKGIK